MDFSNAPNPVGPDKPTHLFERLAHPFRAHPNDQGNRRYHPVQLPAVVGGILLAASALVVMTVHMANVLKNPTRVTETPIPSQDDGSLSGQDFDLAQSVDTLQSDRTRTQVTIPDIIPPIAVLGCSNTWQHAQAYGLSSTEDKMWGYQDIRNYSGGTLNAWYSQSDTGTYWSTFDNNFQQKGANSVWIQICIRSLEASAGGMTTAQQGQLISVVERVRERVGESVPIYVSPLNGFSGTECTQTGTYGQPNSVELADWAEATGLAKRGPDTGPLATSERKSDTCHLNSAGMAVVGPQLVEFFDFGSIPDPDDPPPDQDPLTASPSPATVGQPVTFTDENSGAFKRRWYPGTGAILTTTTPTATWTYTQAGTYTVNLDTKDSAGQRVTHQITLVVN